MTSYQTAAGQKQTNLTANLSVAIILLTSLYLGDAILRCSVSRLILSVLRVGSRGHHRYVDDQRKLGRQTEQAGKSETAIRESIGVVPLALPLMAGPGAISSTIVWGTRYHYWVHLIGFSVAIAIFALCCWGVFRMAPWLVRLLGQTHQRHYPYYGVAIDGQGIESIVTASKAFSRLIALKFHMKERS
ncbi:hypothetical protein KIF59_04600 [Enterobacter cloacae subsp. cloacae]|nr:hypothetical protein [Enterobacter cloacae subsp. cloacae]